MCISAEGNLAHSPQQVSERRRVRQISTQNECVDEKSDQLIEVHPVAIGNGNTDNQVLLFRVAIKQDVESGKERHEKSGVFRPA